MFIFNRYYDLEPIRKVSITFSSLTDDLFYQLDIFNDYEEVKKENSYNEAIDSIKTRFGNNSILKASSLLNDSTIRDRNKKIGGHHE